MEPSQPEQTTNSILEVTTLTTNKNKVGENEDDYGEEGDYDEEDYDEDEYGDEDDYDIEETDNNETVDQGEGKPANNKHDQLPTDENNNCEMGYKLDRDGECVGK